MPTTSPPSPAGPPAGDSTTANLVFLAFGLVSLALLWVVPVAVLLWLSGMFFGSVGIAEMLERTRGLAPTTYGGAFWLAVVVTVAMVALEVRALIRGAPGRGSWLLRFITRPSMAYWVLIGPTLLLVRLDTRGTDVPDILTTTLLLCCLGYVWFVLPLGVAAIAWRLTWWMWRKGSASGFASGLLGMLGLSFAVCTPAVCVVNDENDPPKPVAKVTKAFGRGFDRAKGEDAIDGSLTFMSTLAEVLEDEPKEPAPATQIDAAENSDFPFFGGTSRPDVDADLFDECVDVLYEGHPNSLRNQRISVFVYEHRLQENVAEELVDDVVFELCTKHATIGREPLRSIATVFKMRTDSRRKNWYRHQRVRNQCAVVVQAGGQLVADDPWAVESTALKQAFCDLEEIDRRILVLSALDHDAKEIGEELGLPTEVVRQRKHRAIQKIRRLLQLH